MTRPTESGSAVGRAALFLDRDGVILEAPPRGEYLIDWSQARFVEGIRSLIAGAKAAGYLIVVVTNQSQVARGLLSEDGLQELHTKMRSALDDQVDAIYYCPHRDEHRCECRKPKAGMLRAGSHDLGIALERSIIVGDSDRDVLAGAAAGCRTVFVRNAFNAAEAARATPDVIVDSLAEVLPLL